MIYMAKIIFLSQNHISYSNFYTSKYMDLLIKRIQLLNMMNEGAD